MGKMCVQGVWARCVCKVKKQDVCARSMGKVKKQDVVEKQVLCVYDACGAYTQCMSACETHVMMHMRKR